MSSQVERAERARRGSKRQRDLEALAAEQAATLAALTPTPAAERAWSAVLERAEASPAIRPDSIETWMRPARVVGVDGTTVVLAVPARAVYWLEHRYHGWIGMALRSCSEFFAVRVIEEPSEVRS